jgi:hypothetical protein
MVPKLHRHAGSGIPLSHLGQTIMSDVLHLVQPLPQIASRLFAELTPMKLFTALIAGMFGFLFPGPAQLGLAISLGSLVLLDTATGIVASLVNRRKFRTTRLRRMFIKLFAYFALALLMALVFTHIGEDHAVQAGAVTIIFGLCIVAEATSVVENIARTKVLPPRAQRALEQYIDTNLNEAGDIVSKEETP